MFKRALIGLILVLTVTGPSFGVVSESSMEGYYYYWIIGTVKDSADGLAKADGQKVIIYHDEAKYLTEFVSDIIGATGQSGKSGQFMINAFDFPGTVSGNGNFYISVYQTGGYGAGNTPGQTPKVMVSATGPGYDEAPAMTMEKGKGIQPPGGIVEGPVILTIAKSGTSDLKISWDINTSMFPAYTSATPVDIYIKSGGGSGQYSLATGWEKIVNNNSLVAGVTGFSINPTNRELTHSSQFGAGSAEVYYKGLIAGSTVADATLGLPGAVAVGKFNQTLVKGSNLSAGFNLVSAPFYPNGNTLDSVFSSQLRNAGTQLYAFDDTSQIMSKAEFLTSGTWNISGTVNVEQGRAYWIYDPSGRVITHLGKAYPMSTRSMQSSFNLMGSPTAPTLAAFPSAGLSPQTGHNIYLFNNATQTMEKLQVVNGVWTNADAQKSAFSLIPSLGYWYYNAGSSFTWTVPK